MQLSKPQPNSTSFNTSQAWLSKTTFWQFNLALGLSMLALCVFSVVSSHALMYRFQHMLSSVAAQVGLDSKFDLLNLLISLSFVGLLVALRYSKLAQILKINRLILYIFLLGNIGLLKITLLHYAPRNVRTLTYTDSGLFINYFIGHLTLLGYWLAFIGLVVTLLWHYVIKPRPIIKNWALTLTQSSYAPLVSNAKLSKSIAIIFMIGLVMIALELAREEYQKLIREKTFATEHDTGLPHFNFANWREAITLTQPALDAEKNQDWALAAKEWTKLHEDYPKEFDVLQHRAHAYMQLGQYANALQDGLEMTRLSEKNPQGWQSLCLTALLSKKVESGACQHAAILNPWEAANPLHFAHALLLQGEGEIASHWYQTAIKQISTQKDLQTLLDDFESLKKQGINDAAFSQAQANFAKEGEAWLAKLAPANKLLAEAQAAEEADEDDKAVQLYQKHIDALTDIAGETNGQTLLAKQHLAFLLFALNRTDEALKHFADLQQSVEHALGPDHIKMVDVLNGYAVAYAKAGQEEASNKVAKKALQLSQDLYGIGSQQTATALNNIGSSERKLGNLSAAETALNQSVNISLSQLLPDYQELAKRMNNIGLIYHDIGSLSTAEYYFTNALQMTELAVGKTHPDIFWRVHNLFKVRLARQDFEGAKEWLIREYQVTNLQPTSTQANMKKVSQEDAKLFLQSLSQPIKHPEL